MFNCYVSLQECKISFYPNDFKERYPGPRRLGPKIGELLYGIKKYLQPPIWIFQILTILVGVVEPTHLKTRSQKMGCRGEHEKAGNHHLVFLVTCTFHMASYNWDTWQTCTVSLAGLLLNHFGTKILHHPCGHIDRIPKQAITGQFVADDTSNHRTWRWEKLLGMEGVTSMKNLPNKNIHTKHT